MIVSMENINIEHKRGNPWMMLGVGVFLAVVVVIMATPVVMKSSKKAPATTAVSNAKQIFYLLVEFDGDYGRFPSDATANEHEDLKGYTGKYSNDYFGQFFGGGYTSSEEIFYAKGGSSSKKKPDNVISNRSDQLSEGECGFAYIKGLSTNSLSDTPVLLTPMYGDGYKFNTDALGGKAVVLRIDGAVKQLLIDKKSHLAKIGDGKTLFEGGPDTVWGAEGFDSSKLCYAKTPYSFTPAPLRIPKWNSKEWIMVVLVLLLVIVITKGLFQSLKRTSAKRKN